MLRTAPGRSSASPLRSCGRSAETPRRTPDPGDERDRGVDDQQPLPAHVRQGGAAEQRAEDEAAHADDDHERHRAHPQRVVVEEPEDERVRDRGHHRRGDAEGRAQRDQLAGRVDGEDGQADQAEGGEPDEQDAATAQTVRGRAGGEKQAAEGERVRPAHPLKGRRTAADVAADGRQRDGQQGVVDHLHEEGQAQRGQRDPRRLQGAVGGDRLDLGGGAHGRSHVRPGVAVPQLGVRRGSMGRPCKALLAWCAHAADTPAASPATCGAPESVRSAVERWPNAVVIAVVPIQGNGVPVLAGPVGRRGCVRRW